MSVSRLSLLGFNGLCVTPALFWEGPFRPLPFSRKNTAFAVAMAGAVGGKTTLFSLIFVQRL